MKDPQIQPEKITRPIQLLAAWLAGLVLIDGTFLAAALQLDKPSWAAGLLVIATVINVPLFLVALFLLQTRFRPEMQEDTFYSQYLDRKYSTRPAAPEPLDIQQYVTDLTEHILAVIGPAGADRREPLEKAIETSKLQELVRGMIDNRALAELYVRPALWPALVRRWGDNPAFVEELEALVSNGLAKVDFDDLVATSLTDLGKAVAAEAKGQRNLWNQTNPGLWKRHGKMLAKL